MKIPEESKLNLFLTVNLSVFKKVVRHPKSYLSYV
jgi:hypothetical protein